MYIHVKTIISLTHIIIKIQTSWVSNELTNCCQGVLSWNFFFNLNKHNLKKSCIRETPNLLTNADGCTNTKKNNNNNNNYCNLRHFLLIFGNFQKWKRKISSRRRHALMVGDCASSHKIDYVTKF